MKACVAYHDALASLGNEETGPSSAEVERIWHFLRLKPGARVLEIGSGSGRLLNELQRRGATVFGIEAAPRMVARARETFRLSVREADFCTMELGEMESSFDACMIMADGILGAGGEDDDLTILNRAVACTRPGGRMLVAAPHVAHYMSERSFCPLRCIYAKALPSADGELSYWQRAYQRAELVQMLRWANALVVEPELGPLGEPQTQPSHRNVVVVAERSLAGAMPSGPAIVRPSEGEPKWYETFFRDMKSEYLDYGFTSGTRAESDMLVSLLRLGKESRCLDVACGVGRHTLELAVRGYQVKGIDLSRSMIEIARPYRGWGSARDWARNSRRDQHGADLRQRACSARLRCVPAGPEAHRRCSIAPLSRARPGLDGRKVRSQPRTAWLAVQPAGGIRRLRRHLTPRGVPARPAFLVSTGQKTQTLSDSAQLHPILRRRLGGVMLQLPARGTCGQSTHGPKILRGGL